jgi:hypothetical protein
MTFKMARCRSVSSESEDRTLRPLSVFGGSLLSLIRPNLAAIRANIKHVFEACRGVLVWAGRAAGVTYPEVVGAVL